MIAGNEDIVVSQQEVEALRHELGLDKSFIFQYLDWLGRAVQGNFGFSYMVKKPVIEELMHSLPATVILAVASTVFMLLVSIPAGIYSAVKHNSWFDYMVRGLTFVGVSVPTFGWADAAVDFWLNLAAAYCRRARKPERWCCLL